MSAFVIHLSTFSANNQIYQAVLLVLMSHVDGTGHDMLWYPFLGRSQTKTYIKRCWNDTDLYMYDIFGDLNSLCCRWLPAWKHLRIFSNPICHHNFGYRSLYLVMILPLPVEYDFSSVKRNIFPFGCFNQPFLSRRLGSTFFNRWFLTRKRLENGWERMNMCFFFFSCHFSWLPTRPRSRLLSFGDETAWRGFEFYPCGVATKPRKFYGNIIERS